MTFYESIANQGTQTWAVRMFIETSGECAMHFDQEAKCVTLPSTYFTDLEKKEHKCLKKSTVFILHFAPSLRFTLSLQSDFYTQSAFYPSSAFRSLQSAVFLLHWPDFVYAKFSEINVIIRPSCYCYRQV